MSSPTLDLLSISPPALIPRVNAIVDWIAKTRLDMAEWAACFARPMTSGALASELESLLQTLPGAAIPMPDEDTEDAAHDRYFHVQRVEGDAAATLIRMALSARLMLLREVHEARVSVSREVVEQIDRALADLTRGLLGLDEVRGVGRWEARPAAVQPMARWVRGHQIFAALSQGLVFSFQSLGQAMRAGVSRDVQRWADLTASLLLGSGAAFRLAGDFAVEEYANVIRPSMMPPASPICLSGLMSIDHRHLVQVIRDMRPVLKALHEQEPMRQRMIRRALTTVYDSHIHVCEKFVGDRPSILTAERTDKSGPSLIEQFKSLRLKALEVPAQAPRLRPSPQLDVDGESELRCPFTAAAAAGASRTKHDIYEQ